MIYNAVNVFLYVDIASCIYAVPELPPRVYVGGTRDGCRIVFILLSSFSGSLDACCQVATS